MFPIDAGRGRSLETQDSESKMKTTTAASGPAPQILDHDRLYRDVYEAAPIAFVLWDRDCCITDWNRCAEMMFGWSREEVLARNFFDFLIPPRARPRAEAVVATLLRGVLPAHTIIENLTRNGQIILCEWNHTIRYDEEGGVVGAMSLGLDITGRKRAEEALRESEERLSLIANGLPVLIAYVDSDQTYRFVNSEYTNWFGAEPAEIIGKQVKDVLGAAGYEQVRENIKKVLSGQLVVYESALPLGEGRRRPFLARYIPHRSKRGNVSGYFVLVEDISERKKTEEALKKVHAELERRVEERTADLLKTNRELVLQIEERKQTEEELRQSETQYRTLIDEASDAILLYGPEGNVLDANRKAIELLGHPREELIKRPLTDLHPATSLDEVVSAFHDVLLAGSGSLNDGSILRKDGSVVPVDMTGSVIHLGNRVVVQYLIRDITERKRAEEIVRNIAEGVAASTGEAFFQSLVSHLAQMLDMDYAFVGELCSESANTIATIAVWVHDHFAENFSYSLAQSPCNHVGERVCSCDPGDVQEPFPFHGLTKAPKVESCVSVSLFDSERRLIGVMAVMTEKPSPHPQLVESMLRVFAARASAELERKRAEQALIRSRQNLRLLSAELLTAQEKERARIARELHDGIGQSLGTLKMSIETLLKRAQSSHGRVDPRELSNLVPMIQKTMEEVRNTSMDLRPSTLDTLGILATISWFCREFQTAYDSVRVDKEVSVEESEIPDPLKIVIYRILQEALNNAAKHSNADSVSIFLARANGHITLTVKDNGDGFAPSAEMDCRTGFGLTSMRERTELSGGDFSIESEIGTGTTIRTSWPVPEG